MNKNEQEKMTYLDRIKLVKSEKKITNDELSDITGIPIGTLAKFLAGISESVKLSNFISICEALDVSLDYIVSGTPVNTNNFSLGYSEIQLIDSYRRLDEYGKDLVNTVVEKECGRITGSRRTVSQVGNSSPAPAGGNVMLGREGIKVTRPVSSVPSKKEIPLYDLPVSAGPGEFLDNEYSDRNIRVPADDIGSKADYALRISGNSMEPKFKNGDILLVENTDTVEFGELCVYILDGCGYFKQFGGDRLISLNSEYGPIMFKDFENVSCAGRVLGRIKKK